MNKKILESFISKYYLSGQVESVTWKSENNNLSVSFLGEDRNMIGFLSTDLIQLPDGKYDIYETHALRSLLSVLGDDIVFEIQSDKKGEPIAFSLKDNDNTKVKFVLANSSAIPVVPQIKNLPTFEVIIKLDQKFITRFSKAAAVMKDEANFAVVSDGTTTSVVLGFSDKQLQTNVTIDVDTDHNTPVGPIYFAAKYLRDILQANKEMVDGTISVSSEGLAAVNLNVNNFTIEYFLVEVTV